MFHRCANQIQISYPLLIRTRQASNYSRAHDLLHRRLSRLRCLCRKGIKSGFVLRRSIHHRRVVGSGSRASIAIHFAALYDNPSASCRLGGKLTANQRGQFKDSERHPIVRVGDIKAENRWSKEITQASNRCKRRSGSLPEAEPESNKKDDQYIEGGGCGKIEVLVIRTKAHKQDYDRSNGRSAEGSKHCAYLRAGHVQPTFLRGVTHVFGRPSAVDRSLATLRNISTDHASAKGNHG
jgi:hypothetical protein